MNVITCMQSHFISAADLLLQQLGEKHCSVLCKHIITGIVYAALSVCVLNAVKSKLNCHFHGNCLLPAEVNLCLMAGFGQKLCMQAMLFKSKLLKLHFTHMTLMMPFKAEQNMVISLHYISCKLIQFLLCLNTCCLPCAPLIVFAYLGVVNYSYFLSSCFEALNASRNLDIWLGFLNTAFISPSFL